ncbi:MAG: acyl-CoA dehydrogenase [Myxococcales bacterium]|nr:MAG: acyl-CoA dehydrogenase [Myxococcales bacterium]
MHLEFTPEQRALRQEIRSYYEDLFTPELRAAHEAEREDMGGPVLRQIVGQLGRDGWLTVGWPEEHGGRGFTPLEQFIFWDETYRAHAPLPIIPVNTIGPTLMRYGSEEQKAQLLPQIARGELFFGVGYTEPGAGTDLASLQSTAVRDGDEWVINGQKIFTTHAHDADYIWMAARTNPDAPKPHKGISIILIPTDTPGFSVTPIYTVGRERTNATYFDNVRVPVSNLVGEENQGWKLITSQLNHERITLAVPGMADRMVDEVWEWCSRVPAPGGGTMLEQQWVQVELARVKAKLEAVKILNWRSAWSITAGVPDMAEASAVKVMGTEFFVDCYRTLLEIVGASGAIQMDEPGAMFGGLLEEGYRSATTLTFGGGVNEVQRDIIAMAGLFLPRARRR